MTSQEALNMAYFLRGALSSVLGEPRSKGAEWSIKRIGEQYRLSISGCVQDFKVKLGEIYDLYHRIWDLLQHNGINPSEEVPAHSEPNQPAWLRHSLWFQTKGHWGVAITWPVSEEARLWDRTRGIGSAGKRAGLNQEQVKLLRRYAASLLRG